MKLKRVISLFVAVLLCLTSLTALAFDETILIMPSPAGKVTVTYDDETIEFDVDPVIEEGRTLVPFRAIFETMGCCVDYYADENGKQTVMARRGNDGLILNIGEPKMYFNEEEIELDVPAKIKDDRTLVPIRAITEAFECEVLWDGDTKTVSIYPPEGHFDIKAEKLTKTIKDQDENVLIEAVAYYPVIENAYEIGFVEEINEEYKSNAEQFIADAVEMKEDAEDLRGQMGKDIFSPFVFELTFEETYNICGILTLTNYSYIYVGGAHPSSEMESRTFNPGAEEELSISGVIDEETLGTTLREYLYDLFSKKLEELGVEPDNNGKYEVIDEELGSCNFYLTKKSLVVYFNQGQIAPYAIGVISVEIPYDSSLFFVDMRANCLSEYKYELENDKDYEWVVVDYSKDKLVVSEEYEEYDTDKILSEHFPVGMKTITVKGIKKGNATILLEHTKKGEESNEGKRVIASTFYIDENNNITVVTESDDPDLLK